MAGEVGTPSNRPRRWWVALLLGLFHHPYLAMLYVGQPRRAAVYFALTFLVLPLAIFLLARQGFWPAGLSGMWVYYAIVAAGTIGAIRIAVRHKTVFTGPWFTTWYGLITTAVGFLALIVALRGFVVDWYHVPSAAMRPTLTIGDRVVVSKLAYRSAAPQRGDVVVLTLPEDGIDYVKRVIGLPGEVVVYDAASRQLTIDGVAAEIEGVGPYAAEPDADIVRETIDGRSHLLLDLRGRVSAGGTYAVPAGHYFVLGDHRDNSNDSRSFSFIPREAIFAKVLFVGWNAGEPTRAGMVVD